MGKLPKQLEYYKPRDFSEFFTMLEEGSHQEKKLLAGGTELLPLMREGSLKLDCFIDISGLELDNVVLAEEEVRIGAMVTFGQLCQDHLIQRFFPMLIQSAKSLGAVQTRTLATIGGNICSAVPSCDSAPALIALGAKLILKSKNNKRTAAVENFFTGPRKTVLQDNEILSEVIIPVPQENTRGQFIKFGRRKALSLAIVNVAAALKLNDRMEINDIRIALGAVAPTPVRAYKAEEYLRGKKGTPEIVSEAGRIAAGELKPISDLRASAQYRLHLSGVLTSRAISQCLEVS